MGKATQKRLLGLILTSIFVSWQNAQAEFLKDSSLKGTMALFYRDRLRAGFNPSTRKDTPFETNLHHHSNYIGIDFRSGKTSSGISIDLSAYATFDTFNAGSPDHELNFWNINNPNDFQPNSSDCEGLFDKSCTQDGMVMQTGLVRFNPMKELELKIGYLQPTAPGAFGVNRSFALGRYRGIELQYAADENTSIGMLIADRYKAPWILNDYKFRTATFEEAGKAVSVGYLKKLDAYTTINMGYGFLTNGPRKMSHLKIKHTREAHQWSAAYYEVRDEEVYRSPSWQATIRGEWDMFPYYLTLEALYNRAPLKDQQLVGNFAYRMSMFFGAAAGAYDLFWNNRSDFNHDREVAMFIDIKRKLDDLGLHNLELGTSFAIGHAPSSIKGVDDINEHGWSLYASYRWLKNKETAAILRIHNIIYTNHTRVPNWAPYTNLFQDEKDLRVMLIIPFNLLGN